MYISVIPYRSRIREPHLLVIMPTIYQLVAQALVRAPEDDGVTLLDIVAFVRERLPDDRNSSELAALVRRALQHGIHIGLVKGTDHLLWLEERYCLAHRAGVIFDGGFANNFFAV